MLTTHVHMLTFILAVVGMIGCLGRFDYNVVLALGWIILGDKNPTFSNSFGVSNFCYLVLFHDHWINARRFIINFCNFRSN